MQKRIKWTRSELKTLGMALDRLLMEDASKLIPKEQLIMTFAQHALPQERRRKLTKVQALEVLEKIDQLREEQAVAEFMSTEIKYERPVLPSDPEEAKRWAMLLARMDQMEERIAAKVLPEVTRIIQSQLSKALGEFLDVIADQSKPAVQEKPPVKIAVAYPADASWADEVRPALKKLTKEKIYVSAIAVGNKTDDIKVGEFSLIIALDSMAESSQCGVTMVRMLDVCKKSSIPTERVKQVKCATAAHITGFVRETIRAHTH